jgi:hypothetical protein
MATSSVSDCFITAKGKVSILSITSYEGELHNSLSSQILKVEIQFT